MKLWNGMTRQWEKIMTRALYICFLETKTGKQFGTPLNTAKPQTQKQPTCVDKTHPSNRTVGLQPKEKLAKYACQFVDGD